MVKIISPYKHVIESQQFSKKFLTELFETTKYMKDNEYKVSGLLKGKIVALLFYEPSTRTRFSFESAILRLGAEKITTENAKEFSSASKGETLQDSIKVINAYADFIVLRHFEDDSSEIASSVSNIPIINAGAGRGQHPTQALLDVYTIYENFGKLENLNVALVGDLLRGRTVNSLVYLLSQFKGNKFYFISPENSKAKKGIKEHLEKHEVEYVETDQLDKSLEEVDIVYMTRIQKERFEDIEEYDKAKGKFILDAKNVSLMKKDAIIMHPLPRVDEISTEVDNNPRAKYFEQAKNGLYVRMALLKILNDHNNKK
jgi:aspartate carbamoyltransferase catalytic subunit